MPTYTTTTTRASHVLMYSPLHAHLHACMHIHILTHSSLHAHLHACIAPTRPACLPACIHNTHLLSMRDTYCRQYHHHCSLLNHHCSLLNHP